MKVERLDHLVLTVRDINTTIEFYTSVMGMKKITFGDDRVALTFGNQKINLHQKGNEFEPKAGTVQTGSADLCFIIDQPVTEAIKHLKKHKLTVIEGPVQRTGATGKISSLYFRDPDKNLIEISNYIND
ncbi:VOC family protein [Amphritea sp.]|uniref:VOC family protein n=1 Tax=Amphritea sp. TaxID=1872502 RepID=UPI0025C07E05|nr:VOC family protein [Amphritea sp.]